MVSLRIRMKNRQPDDMDATMRMLWINTLLMVSMLHVFPPTVRSAPISISFDNCQPGEYADFANPTSVTSYNCCPTKPTKPIIDGLPQRTTSHTRIRRAAECTDSAYAAKLQRGYQLMRALPDDDPRSFTQQWYIHCSYCGGSFNTNAGGTETGIDIHFNWLFYPWHRFYLYFHERILQSLLGDPTFSLSYWHWDSPNPGAACDNVGHNFPSAYASPSAPTYDNNRSENAKGNGRLKFPDLGLIPSLPPTLQPLYNAPEQTVINNNLNIMHLAMVRAGTTAETFVGLPYRAGDVRDVANPTTGGGSLETSAHASVHFWTGQDPPLLIDLSSLPTSGRDPAFFAHHSNIDRLFSVWKTLGGNRQYYSDPDFLDASFLFYDENKDLRRVKIKDCLSTRKLGYVYQKSDIAWRVSKATRCSNITGVELLAQARTRPVPARNSKGYYNLLGGQLFTLIIDRPANPSGDPEFLSVNSLELDRTLNAGFDLYVNLLDPENSLAPQSCAEYVGRFMNMAQAGRANQDLAWRTSVTETFSQIGVVDSPSQLVVTIVPIPPLSCAGPGCDTSIYFRSVTIGT